MADPKKKYAGGVRAGARPTTMNVDIELHARLKMLSAMSSRTMSDLIESWILMYAPVETDDGVAWPKSQRRAVNKALDALDAHRDGPDAS